ncbi:uncharacterized protein LOC120332993 [Styela clava]
MVKSCELCNKYYSAQAKMPMMKPDLPSRPWEKLGTDIFEFQGNKYLMIVDYFSRFPVVRKLQDMTAESVCEQFSNVLAEYGLCSTILADFGSQYVSQLFRGKCDANGITMTFSSPYHHQANSLAERAIGTCKSLWKKAKEEGKSLESSLWIYRVTPLDYQTPSPFELLFGRRPRTFMPMNERSLQSKSTELEKQQEINENKQAKQKEFYDRKASIERRPLSKNEDVYVWNDLRRIWEPGKIENIPNPVREPRTCTVLLNSKLYRRTREHLKPRIAANKSKYNEKKFELKPFYYTQAPVIDNNLKNSTTPEEVQNQEKEIKAEETHKEPQPTMDRNTGFIPKAQTTKSGRTTQVPAKFRD